MKYVMMLSFAVLVSCNGRLSDEQKRKIREEREESKIKKVSEAAIMEAAFSIGRKITEMIERRDKTLSNQKFIDSLALAFQAEIKSLQSNDSTLRAVEKQLIEAYTFGGNDVALSDNVQKIGNDSLLYTKPLTQEQPDGSIVFTKVLGIRLAKREIIRTIK